MRPPTVLTITLQQSTRPGYVIATIDGIPDCTASGDGPAGALAAVGRLYEELVPATNGGGPVGLRVVPK